MKIAAARGELRIEVNERDAEPFRQCRARGGLTRASGANQLDHECVV